jgi:SAM-dependent methyltransferase
MSKLVRSVASNRLEYYAERTDPEFWDRHWARSFDPQIYDGPAKGDLVRFYEGPFMQWLPRPGRIVEAGCGFGHLVLALRARGYDAEGVDTAESTVALVRTHRPDLPIRVGDVTRLDVPDGHYAGYISLGVVEHRKEGPQPFLDEALRVLAPDGVAIFTIPWFNRFRAWKGRRGFYRGDASGCDFYQYAFSRDEFVSILRRTGFEVMECSSFDSVKGLKDEVPLLGHLLRLPYLGWRANREIERLLRKFPGFAQSVDHMMLIVARKPDRAVSSAKRGPRSG